MATDDEQMALSPELEAILAEMTDGVEEVSDPFALETSTTDETLEVPADDTPAEASVEDETPAGDEVEVDAEADASDEAAADEETGEADDAEEDAPEEGDAPEEVEEEAPAPAATLSDEDLSKVAVVKVNGKDVEVKVEDLIAGYRKGEAAEEKFREAAEVRKQAESAVEFNNQFNSLWAPEGASKEELRESRAELLGHFLELAGSPEAGGSAEDLYVTWAALTKRVAATGGFSIPGQPQQVAEALGFSDAALAEAKAEHYQSKVSRAEQARAAEAEAVQAESRTQEQRIKDLETVIEDAEMAAASIEEKREYLSQVISFATEKGIGDIHRAHAAFQRTQAKAAQERLARKQQAISSTPMASKRAASASSRPAAAAAPAPDTRSSEEKAYEAIFGRG